MKYDFGGYATKNDLKCSDGRVIKRDAFKHNDGETVPLVWQHMHNEPNNILGHALLENREDGVYAYCKFNDSESGKNASILVKHKDVSSLSIYANSLKQKGSDVIHGAIKEVSIVLAAANPGAKIDNLAIEHSDGSTVTDTEEAIVFTGEELSLDVKHEDKKEKKEETKNEKTLQEIYDTLNQEQKDLMHGMLAQVLEGIDKEAKHSDEAQEIINLLDNNTKSIKHQKGEDELKKNIFEGKDDKDLKDGKTLTHSQIQTIFDDAKKMGSLEESVLKHAGTYGIDDIDFLFPDARKVEKTPEFIKRDTTWVDSVVKGSKHTPFSRIKSLHADITADEARAKGYVKGNLKTEEVFGLLKRTTGPTTIYKKQKLDRDDILDITDFNVVSWLKGEMRIMLDEEVGRGALLGDGRAIDDPDKIDENCLRPIWKDDDFYSHKVKVAAAADTNEIIEAMIRARKNYKGKGKPSFYTTTDLLTDMLLSKDSNGRELYPTEDSLAKKLRVKNIIEVEVMENQSRNDGVDDVALLGIFVNMSDYTMGADKGGKIGMFDDFDIDYNQHKYLIETRLSGALTRYKTALVIEQIEAAG